jgi:pyridoxal phosphate enzyme (YggS family)
VPEASGGSQENSRRWFLSLAEWPVQLVRARYRGARTHSGGQAANSARIRGMGTSQATVAENVAAIHERVEKAAARAGRNPSEVAIVGISKGVPAERILEAFESGIRHFGENRVQEWETKAPVVEGLAATWHLVGHLQRNKASRAIRLFHTIDSLDSLPLAEKLSQAAGNGRRIPVLIEVRLDPAVTKTGCDPAELARLVEGVLLMPHLELRGLMTVPELTADPQQARPMFRRLREIRDLTSRQFRCQLPELSMGMSRDFEFAVEEGATQVRIGTALFGSRPARAASE